MFAWSVPRTVFENEQLCNGTLVINYNLQFPKTMFSCGILDITGAWLTILSIGRCIVLWELQLWCCYRLSLLCVKIPHTFYIVWNFGSFSMLYHSCRLCKVLFVVELYSCSFHVAFVLPSWFIWQFLNAKGQKFGTVG